MPGGSFVCSDNRCSSQARDWKARSEEVWAAFEYFSTRRCVQFDQTDVFFFFPAISRFLDTLDSVNINVSIDIERARRRAL